MAKKNDKRKKKPVARREKISYKYIYQLVTDTIRTRSSIG